MSATELAAVIEGWATLAGLFVVIAGAVFAGVQLRNDAQSRRLQTMLAVLSDVRPPAVTPAQMRVMAWPDGFDRDQLTEEQRGDLLMVMTSYGRLGTLVAAGLIRENDIFRLPALGVYAIEFWEKVKHLERNRGGFDRAGMGPHMPTVRIPVFVEFLAARAQAYLALHGAKQFGKLPQFDADLALLQSINAAVERGREAA